MQIARDLIKCLEDNGFMNVNVNSVSEEGEWSETYAKFSVDFDAHEPHILNEYVDYLNGLLPECDISLLGNTIDIDCPPYALNDIYDDFYGHHNAYLAEDCDFYDNDYDIF